MKITWADHALIDLRNIDAWLSRNVDGSTAAYTLERIRRQAHGLLSFPDRKPRLDRERRYAQVSRTPYLLIYTQEPTSVMILRIRHNRENWRG